MIKYLLIFLWLPITGPLFADGLTAGTPDFLAPPPVQVDTTSKAAILQRIADLRLEIHQLQKDSVGDVHGGYEDKIAADRIEISLLRSFLPSAK